MVFIGGVTRLTESGLSIVEWKVFSGTFPPLTQEAWEQEFLDYQATPEFQKINSYFGLAEFKRIFWLEYIHRLLGRITGFVFFLPLLYAVAKKTLPAPYLWRMTGMTALVGVQGLFGWVMVKSGLQDDPRVDPIRLALHLSTAFFLFSLLWWQWLHIKRMEHFERLNKALTLPEKPPAMLYYAIWGLLLLLSLQIIFGAFVAGYDAGMVYNTYPLMDGQWVPRGLIMLDPWWNNFLEHIPMVQFQHRILAKIVMFLGVLVAFLVWRHSSPEGNKVSYYFAVILSVQFLLGVLTLIHEVPIALASLHQMGALALLAAALGLRFTLKYPSNSV
jgi:cytochrome c oxidase assembly protein subunit 15